MICYAAEIIRLLLLKMIFEILEKEHGIIKVKVIKGGILRKGKGCNIKGMDRSDLYLNREDKETILWGLENNVDIICQSFVENGEYIKSIKSFINKNN